MDNDLKKTIKNCSSWDELCEAIGNFDTQNLLAHDVSVIQRSLDKCDKQSDLKIAYLGDHTIDILPKYVEVVCAINSFRATSYVGAYDQYFQEILDSNGKLHAFSPDIIFLSLTTRTLTPDIYGRFLELSTEEKIQEQKRVLAYIEEWINAAKKFTEASLLVSNMVCPIYKQAGIADAKLEYSEAEWYSEFNLELLRTFKQDSRVNILGLEHITSCYGLERAYDSKMYYMARMEWTESFLPTLANHLFRYIVALKGLAKKCLVVDLDNTIWGGVVGEEGADGVNVDKGYTEGEIYYDFQRVIRSLKSRGILLAICSKNNPDDAQEVFEIKTEMPLKFDDFAAAKINWDYKHNNLLEIASLLNIGTDSLVFLDDNPVERELVKSTLNEISTIELPADPTGYLSTLKAFPFFEKLSITSEDSEKSNQYKENARRQDSKNKIGDMKSFLESLVTELTLEPATTKHIPRAHQLFTKTNQFNVTTKRYGISDIEKFISDVEWDLHIASVKDKFGDLGIIGLYLIKKNNATGYIDSFILSCRAMGRGIETAMMNKIKSDYLLKNEVVEVFANYLPTAKNKPVLEFFDNQGFMINRLLDKGMKEYLLKAQDAQLNEHSGITVKVKEVKNGKNDQQTGS